jgi:hypothetical protein
MPLAARSAADPNRRWGRLAAPRLPAQQSNTDQQMSLRSRWSSSTSSRIRPPDSYPDRTRTGKRRRAYEHRSTTYMVNLLFCWTHE